jgi:hypothetical protein
MHIDAHSVAGAIELVAGLDLARRRGSNGHTGRGRKRCLF